MTVWDGHRPRSPRVICTQQQAHLQGAEFRFVTETITSATDWCFREPRHTVVVHRSGTLTTMDVDFEDGPCGPCLPRVGDVWIIPAEHRYAALAQGSTVRFCEISVPTTLFGQRQLLPRVGAHDPFLHQLVERLHDHMTSPGLAATLFRESLSETLQHHLLDRYAAAPRAHRAMAAPAPRLDERTQQRLMDFLDAELSHGPALTTLARLAHMSPRHLLRAFTETFGTTPHQYVIARRVQRAEVLLRTTTDSVTSISTSLGFANPSHFATTFKHRTGRTPTAYRADPAAPTTATTTLGLIARGHLGDADQ